MYQIVRDSQLIALCDKPRYVKVKPETGAYIQAAGREDATGVAVGGEVYGLADVDIREIDGAEIVFEHGGELTRLAEETAAIEDALCEMDAGGDGEE